MEKNKPLPKKMVEEFKAKSEVVNRRMRRTRLRDNVTYYNVKAFEAYERGDYEMAADYTELVKRNMERLAAM